MILKRIATRIFRPAAVMSTKLDPFMRVWAHARLSAALSTRVDASIVVLAPVEIRGTGRIHLGCNLYLYRDLYFETQAEGEIHIGNDVVISRGVHLCAFSRIELGAGSLIGEFTSIRDANHVYGENTPLRCSGHTARPVLIGRNVWIGRGVAVLGGVTIGDGAVIGANAVVTRDVPAGAVVAGVPARPVERAAAR